MSSLRLSKRRKPHRDARRFVLALEGEQNGEEYRYFDKLPGHLKLDRRKIDLVLVPTPKETHASAPSAVLERALRERKRVLSFDDIWLVVDPVSD